MNFGLIIAIKSRKPHIVISFSARNIMTKDEKHD